MRVEVIRPGELVGTDLARWRALQSSNANLRSPFFAPEFACAVAAARDDAFVAVVGQAGKAEALFPFHRAADREGLPIGLRICDYHGVIGPESPAIDSMELLSACGLSRFDFRCVPVTQTIFAPWQTTMLRTVSIDLATAQLPARVAARVSKMRRRIERDLGPLRLTWHNSTPDALRKLIACKSAQYQRTGTANVFGAPWIVKVLERLHRSVDAGASGILSELHAGDELVSAHLGLRSATVLHYWFPCYQVRFARYSPGLMLLRELTTRAAAEGITRIDLGFANAPYKEIFANRDGAVMRGSVIVPEDSYNV